MHRPQLPSQRGGVCTGLGDQHLRRLAIGKQRVEPLFGRDHLLAQRLCLVFHLRKRLLGHVALMPGEV